MKSVLKSGTIKWIPLADLDPHPLAQRRLDVRRAGEIARDFNPALMGTITVAETKKGKLWIVDGQTRASAALQWLDGDTAQCVECKVIAVADDAAAAELFIGLNNHKAVKTIDKFLVRIVAKDAVALGIVAVLARVNLRVDRTRSDGVVQAVDACEWLFKRERGALLLERTIRVLHNAWGPQIDAYHALLIKGLGLLLAKHGSVIDDEDLVRKLAKHSGPLGWIGDGRDRAGIMGVAMHHGVSEAIQAEYNKGRRTGRLVDRAA